MKSMAGGAAALPLTAPLPGATAPGLGVTLDEDAIEKYRTG